MAEEWNPFDWVDPVVQAIGQSLGDALGVVRVFLADTLGQFLVGIYTPVYMIIDFVIASFQTLFGLVELVAGWLPAPIYLAILAFVLLYLVAYIARFIMTVIHG